MEQSRDVPLSAQLWHVLIFAAEHVWWHTGAWRTVRDADVQLKPSVCL